MLSLVCEAKLFRFRLGAHSLPVKQGKKCGQSLVARACLHCTGQHVRDERHLVLSTQLLIIQDSSMVACLPIHTPSCFFSCGMRIRRMFLMPLPRLLSEHESLLLTLVASCQPGWRCVDEVVIIYLSRKDILNLSPPLLCHLHGGLAH